MNRRALLRASTSLAPAALLTAVHARFLEPSWLAGRNASCPLPNLHRPLRLVHLSDLHASTVVPPQLIEAAIDRAAALRPDLIAVTGDFITDPDGFDPAWYRRVLARLARTAPTFATMGNHDGGAWSARAGGYPSSRPTAQLVIDAGIQVLHNRPITLPAGESSLTLVGLGDIWAKEFAPEKAFDGVAPNSPTIVLSHNPDTKQQVASYHWNLMLSGHTHGGQVVIPVLGAPWAPVKDKRYLAGLKPWGNRWIHVSRGVGSAGGVRLNCRPEITLIDLVPARA